MDHSSLFRRLRRPAAVQQAPAVRAARSGTQAASGSCQGCSSGSSSRQCGGEPVVAQLRESDRWCPPPPLPPPACRCSPPARPSTCCVPHAGDSSSSRHSGSSSSSSSSSGAVWRAARSATRPRGGAAGPARGCGPRLGPSHPRVCGVAARSAADRRAPVLRGRAAAPAPRHAARRAPDPSRCMADGRGCLGAGCWGPREGRPALGPREGRPALAEHTADGRHTLPVQTRRCFHRARLPGLSRPPGCRSAAPRARASPPCSPRMPPPISPTWL